MGCPNNNCVAWYFIRKKKKTGRTLVSGKQQETSGVKRINYANKFLGQNGHAVVIIIQ